MNDTLRESISALMDGEADELELRRLLADTTPEVGALWQSFHLQRDALAGVDMRFANLDIAGRVQAALANESVAFAKTQPRWWRPLASVAVAASVATVVAIGARGFSVGQNGVGVGAANVAQVAPLAATAGRVYPATVSPQLGNVAVSAQFNGVSPLQSVSANADDLAQQRLQRFMLRHTERAALTNGQGLISFARVSELDDK